MQNERTHRDNCWLSRSMLTNTWKVGVLNLWIMMSTETHVKQSFLSSCTILKKETYSTIIIGPWLHFWVKLYCMHHSTEKIQTNCLKEPLWVPPQQQVMAQFSNLVYKSTIRHRVTIPIFRFFPSNKHSPFLRLRKTMLITTNLLSTSFSI